MVVNDFVRSHVPLILGMANGEIAQLVRAAWPFGVADGGSNPSLSIIKHNHMAIVHHGAQAVLDNYVARTDYSVVPKIGKLNVVETAEFDRVFTRMSDLFGKKIYYVGCIEGQHTFTDELGWKQYQQYISK